MQRNVLLKYIARVWFVYRLLTSTVAKVIKKYNIDTKDPSTVDYTVIYMYIEKSTALEKAI